MVITSSDHRTTPLSADGVDTTGKCLLSEQQDTVMELERQSTAKTLPRIMQQRNLNEPTGLSHAPRDHWVRDEIATHCHSCHQPFNVVTCRRHHCRRCGEIFCTDCCSLQLRLPERYGYGTLKVRACEDCVIRTSHENSSQLADELDIRNEINSNLKHALREKSRFVDECKKFLLWMDEISTKDCSNTVQANNGEGSDEESMEDGMTELLSRCRETYRELKEKALYEQTIKQRSDNQIVNLELALQSKCQEITALHGRIKKLQQETTEFRNEDNNRTQLQEIIESQERLLTNRLHLLKQLEYRCQELERANMDFVPHTTPSIIGNQSYSRWGTDHPYHNLEEPLVQVVSSGNPSGESFLYSCRLRATTHNSSLGYSKLTDRIQRWCCCCCKRRKRDQVLPQGVPHPSDSSTRIIIQDVKKN